MLKPLLITALLLAAGHGTALAADVRSVQELDLGRYAGSWYEQASFPMYFQRNCAGNTTANYALQPDATIRVSNRCEKQDGTMIEAEGIAKPSGNGPAELKVRFAPAFLSWLPFVWADYWVIALDGDYQWAVVGTPNREYLWILSREKTISAELFKQLSDKAKQQGFDISKLKMTQQT